MKVEATGSLQQRSKLQHNQGDQLDKDVLRFGFDSCLPMFCVSVAHALTRHGCSGLPAAPNWAYILMQLTGLMCRLEVFLDHIACRN